MASASPPTPAPSHDDLVAAAAALGHALRALGLRVATAESCTGGLIAWALTETAGSSDWFERGHVVYSNDAKREVLGVAGATLVAHGAVSEPCAREMAIGALARSRAALALSVTGIAGPGGGSADKPVGTVCFGWAFAAPGLPAGAPLASTATVAFAGDRAEVRRRTAMHAIERALSTVRAELADRPPTA
jgi:nicotinamide-nucleotide amidase